MVLYKSRIIKKLDGFEEYLLAAGKSQSTAVRYIEKVRQLLDFIKKDTITKDDIIKFLAHCRKNKSQNTYCLIYYALQSFFKYIKQEKLLDGIPQPKKPFTLPKYLTMEELEALIKYTVNPRDRAILLLLFATGLRVSELCSLKIKDVDFERGVIRVFREKTEIESEIPVADFALIALREAINTYINKSEDAPLFQNKFGEQLSIRSVQRIVTNAAKRAGINKKVSPHVLRHTFATFALSKGFNLPEIQEILGHASIRTTRIYSHVIKSELERKYHTIFSNRKEEEERPITIRVIYCPKCGYKIGQGWRFCLNCGADLSKIDVS